MLAKFRTVFLPALAVLSLLATSCPLRAQTAPDPQLADNTSESAPVEKSNESIQPGSPVGVRIVEEASPTTPDDEAIDSQIDQNAMVALLKIIDLERWSMHYKLVATHEPRSRHLRYFLAQDAAAALFLASQIEGLDEAAIGIHSPKDVSSQVLHDANVCGLLGAILEGGSSAVELGSNGILALKNRSKGQDPATARRGARARLKEIDALLRQRDQLVAKTRGARSVVYEDESKLLKNFRDRTLFEFSDLYADVKANQRSNNMYYALDVVGSACYMASYLIGFKSFANSNYVPASLIVGLVADGLYLPSAPLYAWAYNKLNAHYLSRLSQELNERFVDTGQEIKDAIPKLHLDAKLLHESYLSGGIDQQVADRRIAKLFLRIGAYELWARRIDEYVAGREVLLRQLARVARQSNMSGPPIAASFLGADIIGLNAHYNLSHNEKATNANLFGGFVTTTAASAFDFGFTTGWFIDDEITYHRLRKLHALPEQLVHQRITTLDELDRLLSNQAAN